MTATAGNGGQGTGGASGGAGGSLNNAGAGGLGGSVLIRGKDSINIHTVDVSGGAGGGLTGQGGQGGSGFAGGAGGSIGGGSPSGAGGGGGKLNVITSRFRPFRRGTITVAINDVVNAGGGAAGIFTGTAGNGGVGTVFSRRRAGPEDRQGVGPHV